MRSNHRKVLFLAAVLFSTFSYAGQQPLDLATMTHLSDRIVRGRITSLSCTRGTNEYGDELIYTHVGVHVVEALKGSGSDFNLTAEGGTIDGLTLTVSDSPEFKTGEDVVLFVKRTSMDYRPLGGLRSKLSISESGAILENGIDYKSLRNAILQEVHRNR